MHRIIRGNLADPRFTERFAEPMFRQRYRVFRERLQWDVADRDGLEIDQFDDRHSRYLLLADGPQLVGGWRLRPTTQPYMLDTVFPQLLGGEPAPRHGAVWEVSRFAIEADERRSRFGFNQAARELLAATAQFALDHGIVRYVMVASTAAERLYRNVGLRVQRFAAPQRIGRVGSVACWVDIDDHTCRVLLGHGLPLAEAA